MSAPTVPTPAELRASVQELRSTATSPATDGLADALDNLLDVLGYERPACEVQR